MLHFLIGLLVLQANILKRKLGYSSIYKFHDRWTTAPQALLHSFSSSTFFLLFFY